jgi:hypothetical protein
VVTHASVAVLQSCPLAHVVVPATQRAIVTSHVSSPLHATPSEQLRAAPTQIALAVQASPTEQKS